ncbi:MAG: BON domain-containing protein [Pseudomonas sp.]|nr:BON domain-containing protein [Pseudomonas sp.]
MYSPTRTLLIATGMSLSMAAMGVSASTVAQDISDARQEAQIWTTYTLSPYLSASDLSVVVHDGLAILTGKVNDEVNKDLATQIALGVSGIQKVDNQIVVQADFSPPATTARGYNQVVEDASISAAVKSKLIWSKYTDAQAVAVETLGGQVTLTGVAESAKAKELAGRMAMNTRGVVSVDNQLKVASVATSVAATAKQTTAAASQKITDSWITAKVKSTLLYSSNVSGADVGVSTDAGVVSLTGTLSSGAERALAIELADNVRGVKSVNPQALSF